VVLAIEGLDIDKAELHRLIEQLNTRNVRIMGIEGARASLLGADLPPAMTDGRPASELEAPVAAELIKAHAARVKALPDKATPSLIIAEPVRSGQSLFFPEGDVTVVGSVASGAEVVAGGSIHIYGTLRGRAMAGTTGNADARIFYRKALPLIDIEVFSGIHVPQFNWTRARVSTNVNAISGVVPASCNDVNGAS